MHRLDPAIYLHPMSPHPTHLLPGGSLKKPIEALLCDIYGTLLISGSGDVGTTHPGADDCTKLERLLDKYHLRIPPVDLTKRMHTAIKAAHLQARASGIKFPEVVIEKIWLDLLPLNTLETARRFATEYELITNPIWPMPGMHGLLDACRLSGIRLGIISNAQFYTPVLFEWLLGESLSALGFDPDLMIFSFEHGCAKPCSHLFDLAKGRLITKSILPARAAFIGNDMRNDIAPAARQGFQTILFAGDGRSLRLRESETDTVLRADRVITELSQLIEDLT